MEHKRGGNICYCGDKVVNLQQLTDLVLRHQGEKLSLDDVGMYKI